MATALFTHPACLLHDNGPLHPESPERLKAILAELEKTEFKSLKRHEAPQATIGQIATVHDGVYIDDIFAFMPRKSYFVLDFDISLCPSSGEAALRAAGALIAAVDEVMSGNITNAFCAVRPPGHHAAQPPSSGFCLFNNIAIGAAHAIEQHDLKRIAIVDFDVHHGNGTENWAKQQDKVLFISSHQFPLWPGSGRKEDKGPNGNIINIPLPPDSGSVEFRAAMENIALPALADFKPELIMISAGFDAHRDDPLANLQWIEDDFSWITMQLGTLAKLHCRGRIVSTLEGGYNLTALAKCVGAHVKALILVSQTLNV
jgi:acetoin utilization deacetylase AcuC-like enzyme